MKKSNTFWIVVGTVSVVVAGACLLTVYWTDNSGALWGLLLMPILWASHKDHGKERDE